MSTKPPQLRPSPLRHRSVCRKRSLPLAAVRPSPQAPTRCSTPPASQSRGGGGEDRPKARTPRPWDPKPPTYRNGVPCTSLETPLPHVAAGATRVVDLSPRAQPRNRHVTAALASNSEFAARRPPLPSVPGGCRSGPSPASGGAQSECASAIGCRGAVGVSGIGP